MFDLPFISYDQLLLSWRSKEALQFAYYGKVLFKCFNRCEVDKSNWFNALEKLKNNI